MVNMPFIRQYCYVCKKFVQTAKDAYICGHDLKTYEVHPNHISDEGNICVCCHNGGFEYDKEVLRGVRF